MDLRRHFVYLLSSLHPDTLDQYYIGYTTNPLRRLREHNGEDSSGQKGALYTRLHGRPWRLLCVVSGFLEHRIALKMEWAWQHPMETKLLRPLLVSAPPLLQSRRGVRQPTRKVGGAASPSSTSRRRRALVVGGGTSFGGTRHFPTAEKTRRAGDPDGVPISTAVSPSQTEEPEEEELTNVALREMLRRTPKRHYAYALGLLLGLSRSALFASLDLCLHLVDPEAVRKGFAFLLQNGPWRPLPRSDSRSPVIPNGTMERREGAHCRETPESNGRVSPHSTASRSKEGHTHDDDDNNDDAGKWMQQQLRFATVQPSSVALLETFLHTSSGMAKVLEEGAVLLRLSEDTSAGKTTTQKRSSYSPPPWCEKGEEERRSEREDDAFEEYVHQYTFSQVVEAPVGWSASSLPPKEEAGDFSSRDGGWTPPHPPVYPSTPRGLRRKRSRSPVGELARDTATTGISEREDTIRCDDSLLSPSSLWTMANPTADNEREDPLRTEEEGNRRFHRGSNRLNETSLRSPSEKKALHESLLGPWRVSPESSGRAVPGFIKSVWGLPSMQQRTRPPPPSASPDRTGSPRRGGRDEAPLTNRTPDHSVDATANGGTKTKRRRSPTPLRLCCPYPLAELSQTVEEACARLSEEERRKTTLQPSSHLLEEVSSMFPGWDIPSGDPSCRTDNTSTGVHKVGHNTTVRGQRDEEVGCPLYSSVAQPAPPPTPAPPEPLLLGHGGGGVVVEGVYIPLLSCATPASSHPNLQPALLGFASDGPPRPDDGCGVLPPPRRCRYYTPKGWVMEYLQESTLLSMGLLPCTLCGVPFAAPTPTDDVGSTAMQSTSLAGEEETKAGCPYLNFNGTELSYEDPSEGSYASPLAPPQHGPSRRGLVGGGAPYVLRCPRAPLCVLRAHVTCMGLWTSYHYEMQQVVPFSPFSAPTSSAVSSACRQDAAPGEGAATTRKGVRVWLHPRHYQQATASHAAPTAASDKGVEPTPSSERELGGGAGATTMSANTVAVPCPLCGAPLHWVSMVRELKRRLAVEERIKAHNTETLLHARWQRAAPPTLARRGTKGRAKRTAGAAPFPPKQKVGGHSGTSEPSPPTPLSSVVMRSTGDGRDGGTSSA